MDNPLRKGERLFREGRIEEAERFFLSVVRSDSSNRDAFNNLGVIAFRQNRYNDALRYFGKALEIDPYYITGIVNYCAVLKEQGRLCEAIRFIEPALHRYPEEQTLRSLLREARGAQPGGERTHGAHGEAENPMRIAAPTKTGTEADFPLQGRKIALVNAFDNKFNRIFSARFGKFNDVRLVRPRSPSDLDTLSGWADLVWSLWANEPLVHLSSRKQAFALVTHLRSYEVLYPPLMKSVRWENVRGIVFVADHIRRIANEMWEDRLGSLPQRTVHNFVELNEYPFYEKQRGRNIGYVGYLNHKKGVGLLVQCIHEAVRSDPGYRLHIAGTFQEVRFEVYMKHIISELGLEDHVVFHGWVKDIPAFLKDMNYVISTSPWEGCPNNIIEAMACGVKPLVHNWKGAGDLFPRNLVFNTIPEFLSLLKSDEYDSKGYREWVAEHFNAERQVRKIAEFFREIG